MRYRLVGRTGLRVSELCLGAMVFGDRRGSWGASPEEAAAIRAIEQAAPCTIRAHGHLTASGLVASLQGRAKIHRALAS